MILVSAHQSEGLPEQDICSLCELLSGHLRGWVCCWRVAVASGIILDANVIIIYLFVITFTATT